MTEEMEIKIIRAQIALDMGVSEEEVAAHLQEQETPEIAFLAVKAAKILNKPNTLAKDVDSDASCSQNEQ
jgi:hypothetical protein